MSYDYTLNYNNFGYVPYDGSVPYDYNGSYTLNGNYQQAVNTQTSIFNTNGALTLPQAQENNASNVAQTTIPPVSPAEASVPAIDGEKPRALEELQMEMLMTGTFMGAPMVLPKVAGLDAIKNSLNASKLTSVMIENGSKPANVAESARTATAYSDIFNSHRLEDAIKGANRPQGQTDEILRNLKKLREKYNDALKAKDAVKMAQVAAEMDVLVKESKMPNWFVRTWCKVRRKPLPVGKSFSDISSKMANAGKEAAKAVEATQSASGASNLTKAANWVKEANKSGGFKAMAIFEGVIEGITEIFPAFSKGGAEEGFIQTGKSAVNVAASASGWCVGAKAGAWAGAAIGSCICPGIGTAIGGAIGSILGGVIGSWGAKKIAKCATGESFSEKQEKIEKAEKAAKEAKAQAETQAQETVPTATQPQVEQTSSQQTVEGQSTPAATTTTATTASNTTSAQGQAQGAEITPEIWMKYFNGTANEHEKALVEARFNAARTEVMQQHGMNPYYMPSSYAYV